MSRNARALWLPGLLTALVVGWCAAAVDEKPWLLSLVFAAVGAAGLPVFLRVRTRRGFPMAVVSYCGILIVGWLVAVVVWAPFVGRE